MMRPPTSVILFFAMLGGACEREATQAPPAVFARSVAGLTVQTCGPDAPCPAGECLNIGTDRICTTRCGTDTDCAAEWHCATERTIAVTKKYCAPGPRVPAGFR